MKKPRRDLRRGLGRAGLSLPARAPAFASAPDALCALRLHGWRLVTASRLIGRGLEPRNTGAPPVAVPFRVPIQSPCV